MGIQVRRLRVLRVHLGSQAPLGWEPMSRTETGFHPEKNCRKRVDWYFFVTVQEENWDVRRIHFLGDVPIQFATRCFFHVYFRMSVACTSWKDALTTHKQDPLLDDVESGVAWTILDSSDGWDDCHVPLSLLSTSK